MSIFCFDVFPKSAGEVKDLETDILQIFGYTRCLGETGTIRLSSDVVMEYPRRDSRSPNPPKLTLNVCSNNPLTAGATAARPTPQVDSECVQQ
ncbi:hypothetical protein RRG08_014507 [Elysia crispata]|uniref:Uncharacterized protein n=1 Tax=Elysia crispata TaxID=231223 RepID=A0AAE1AVK1_9GAST|nr:hypothetical protein RRG08_014507 [Elysia crispata]